MNSTVFLLVLLAPASLAVFCYVGQQEVAELEPAFDICVSILNLKTEEISYEGMNGKTMLFEEDGDVPETHCLPIIMGRSMEMRCYCNSNKCNKMLNPREFANQIPLDF